jgi:hypothetical protein
MNNYEDIINLNHYNPKFHPRVSIYNRSAQFAPFAALTGYDEAIIETARLTEDKIELNDDLRNFIDMKLHIIEEHIKEKSIVKILYFEKDKRKQGGKYIEYSGIVKRIDLINKFIIFEDKFKIGLEVILNIDADFIKEL